MYLPNAKAPGASLITAEMLKPIRADVSVLLTLLFTLCYITGYIPLQWRQAILCPILKKGNPSDIENYRPISLTETFRKIYEKALLPAFQCFIEPLSIYQNGFRCYRSTVDHVAALQYISQTTKGKHGKSLVYAFLDIKAAYDKVNRLRLWAKFRTKSMPERLVSSARSLFDSTTSRVAINNTLGGSFDNYSGLLQGSILSPIFYAFFIDDLPKLLKDQGPWLGLGD